MLCTVSNNTTQYSVQHPNIRNPYSKHCERWYRFDRLNMYNLAKYTASSAEGEANGDGALTDG